MNEQAFLFSLFIGGIVMAIVVIGASFGQWRHIQTSQKIAARMRQLRGVHQPAVTVLVYARNQQVVIEQALRALRANRYHAFDVVVIDDASTDATNKIVKRFCAKYSTAAIRILRRHKPTTVAEALRAGYRKSQRGSIVLTLTPDQTIDTQCIKRAVAMQNTRGRWRVTLRRTFDATLRIADIGERLEQYVWHQESWVYAYSTSVFLNKHTIATAGMRSEADQIGALSVLMALVFIVGSIAMFGIQSLWYVWVVFVAYGMAVIWMRFDEQLRDKLVATFALPLALFLVPVTSIVRGFSQLYVRK